MRRAVALLALTCAAYPALGRADTHGQPTRHAPVVASEPATPVFPTAWTPVADAMSAELERALGELGKAPRGAPYYLGHWLVDVSHFHVETKYGSLLSSSETHSRFIRSEMRVGSMELDNSNYMAASGSVGSVGFGVPMEQGPLDGNTTALRRSLWLLTDDNYQSAIDLLDQKRAEQQSSVKQASAAPDFSEFELLSIVADEAPGLPERATLEALAREASSAFLTHPDVDDASVTVDAWRLERVFVSSAGVRSYAPARYIRFSAQSFAQASDGMPVASSEQIWGEADATALRRLVDTVATRTETQRKAALATDYSGPILFEGVAAAQLAFELLGETLSGTPSSDGSESPWLRRLGKRVLPRDVDVFDDPTLNRYRGLTVFGGQAFDDEGVPATRVELVKQGRLRSLLMSRTPNEHLQKSNGHGRSGVGGWARGALANLVLESKTGKSGAELRKRLLAQVKDEGGSFGIVVQSLEQRDYSTMGTALPRPERIIKLYLDGREEVVRGAELFEVTPRDLKDIVAVGDTSSVYTVTQFSAGALPSAASVVAPALLFDDVEIRRPTLAHELPAVLPRPPL